MSAAQTRELDFGQQRRLEAQLAMRAVVGRLEKDPFTGARLAAGEVVPSFETVAQAGEYYLGALDAYLRGLGAEVKQFSTPISGSLPIEDAQPMAPWEQMLIHGQMPASVIDARHAGPQLVEACAELVRVILATAVVAAGEDCQGDEEVVVYFRALEFGERADFAKGTVVGLVRVRALVYTSMVPQASYILGNVLGREALKPLVWEFPYVEHVYGPNRLRWRDLRSPDYEAVPAPKVVVPS